MGIINCTENYRIDIDDLNKTVQRKYIRVRGQDSAEDSKEQYKKGDEYISWENVSRPYCGTLERALERVADCVMLDKINEAQEVSVKQAIRIIKDTKAILETIIK